MVLDDVLERIPVVSDLGIALLGSKVITTVVLRLIGLVAIELNCRGGASEKGKIEDLLYEINYKWIVHAAYISLFLAPSRMKD